MTPVSTPIATPGYTPAEIPAALDVELFLIADLEADVGQPGDPIRKIYRSRCKRYLVLAEHQGGTALQIGMQVARSIPTLQAGEILMRDPAAIGHEAFVLALGLVDAQVRIEELMAKLARMEARAVRAEAEARDVGMRSDVERREPAASRQGALL